MTRARTTIRTVSLLGMAALVAAGCGGGDAPVPPATGATPAPGADPNAPTVGGAVDPATGLPVDPATVDPATGLPATGTTIPDGATASVPDLSGDDVAGGLGSTESNPIFLPGAIDTEKAKDKFREEAKADSAGGGSTPTDTPKEPAVVFSGAKVYVDGIVHDVNENDVFPKSNPVFRLLSVTASDIEIELVAGEFTSGGGVGTILDKGELVSMVNASEQLTYRIKYMRPITSADAISF